MEKGWGSEKNLLKNISFSDLSLKRNKCKQSLTLSSWEGLQTFPDKTPEHQSHRKLFNVVGCHSSRQSGLLGEHWTQTPSQKLHQVKNKIFPRPKIAIPHKIFSYTYSEVVTHFYAISITHMKKVNFWWIFLTKRAKLVLEPEPQLCCYCRKCCKTNSNLSDRSPQDLMVSTTSQCWALHKRNKQGRYLNCF